LASKIHRVSMNFQAHILQQLAIMLSNQYLEV